MEMRYTIPDYIHCYECGHPADILEENENESNINDSNELERYLCYDFKCVKCGTETLRCFRPECNR
jgi:hypothetical protein